jgi:hypothetical protein
MSGCGERAPVKGTSIFYVPKTNKKNSKPLQDASQPTPASLELP